MTRRDYGPMVTLAQLHDLRAELIGAGLDADELADELGNAAQTGCGTDTYASLRVELGLR